MASKRRKQNADEKAASKKPAVDLSSDCWQAVASFLHVSFLHDLRRVNTSFRNLTVPKMLRALTALDLRYEGPTDVLDLQLAAEFCRSLRVLHVVACSAEIAENAGGRKRRRRFRDEEEEEESEGEGDAKQPAAEPDHIARARTLFGELMTHNAASLRSLQVPEIRVEPKLLAATIAACPNLQSIRAFVAENPIPEQGRIESGVFEAVCKSRSLTAIQILGSWCLAKQTRQLVKARGGEIESFWGAIVEDAADVKALFDMPRLRDLTVRFQADWPDEEQMRKANLASASLTRLASVRLSWGGVLMQHMALPNLTELSNIPVGFEVPMEGRFEFSGSWAELFNFTDTCPKLARLVCGITDDQDHHPDFSEGSEVHLNPSTGEPRLSALRACRLDTLSPAAVLMLCRAAPGLELLHVEVEPDDSDLQEISKDWLSFVAKPRETLPQLRALYVDAMSIRVWLGVHGADEATAKAKGLNVIGDGEVGWRLAWCERERCQAMEELGGLEFDDSSLAPLEAALAAHECTRERAEQEALDKRVSDCLARGKCSFTVTGSTSYAHQAIFQCFTCLPGTRSLSSAGEIACCKVCADVCHKGHNLEPSTAELSFCDCGPGSMGAPCRALVGTDGKQNKKQPQKQSKKQGKKFGAPAKKAQQRGGNSSRDDPPAARGRRGSRK